MSKICIIFVIMNINSNIPEIVALRERVEAKLGKRLEVHSDFLDLVVDIETKMRQHISETTLERVWQYSTRRLDTVSVRTLNLLATYAEGVSWHDFCQKLYNEGICESHLFTIERIHTKDIERNDRIEFGWLPERRCIVRYMGEDRFVAEECHNSKIKKGDSFLCSEFEIGKILKMYGLKNRDDDSGNQTYVVGTNNGLTLLRYIPQ